MKGAAVTIDGCVKKKKTVMTSKNGYTAGSGIEYCGFYSNNNCSWTVRQGSAKYSTSQPVGTTLVLITLLSAKSAKTAGPSVRIRWSN